MAVEGLQTTISTLHINVKTQTLWSLLNVKAHLQGQEKVTVERLIQNLKINSIISSISKSAFQADVVSILRKSFAHLADIQEEYALIGSNVDVAIPSQRIVIEVQGPHHYTNDNKPNNQTRLKLRILQAQGWHVLEVPYFEWNALKSGREKENFLKERLDKLLSEALTKRFAQLTMESKPNDKALETQPVLLNQNADLNQEDPDDGFCLPKKKKKKKRKA